MGLQETGYLRYGKKCFAYSNYSKTSSGLIENFTGFFGYVEKNQQIALGLSHSALHQLKKCTSLSGIALQGVSTQNVCLHQSPERFNEQSRGRYQMRADDFEWVEEERTKAEAARARPQKGRGRYVLIDTIFRATSRLYRPRRKLE